MKDILLLDLGGVLADLGDPVGMMGLDMNSEHFWDVWLNSPSVRAFETGAFDTPTFADRIAAELGVAHESDFESVLRRWHLPLFPEVEEFLASVSDRYRLSLLSNTNEPHWQQVLSSTSVFERFDSLFLSFETGYYKPEEQAFLQVLDHYECRPEDVIFMDDSARNVDTANALGIRASRVMGVEGMAEALP